MADAPERADQVAALSLDLITMAEAGQTRLDAYLALARFCKGHPDPQLLSEALLTALVQRAATARRYFDAYLIFRQMMTGFDGFGDGDDTLTDDHGAAARFTVIDGGKA